MTPRGTDPLPPITIDTGGVSVWVALIVVAAVLVLIVGVLSVFLYALTRAANMRDPALLVVSLSALTYLAIMGAITTEVEALETIAAAGVGALAAAVASTFRDPKPPED